jgi:hypothetical protein
MAEFPFDISHIFFLELIRDFKNNLGSSMAIRQMTRRVLELAQHLPQQYFPDKASFWEAMGKGQLVFNFWDTGMRLHEHDLVTIDRCPFEVAIGHYMKLWGGLPGEYEELTNEYNKPSELNEDLKIGCGSASSPFCIMHQPLRAISSTKIVVGGEAITFIQMGCKSALNKIDISAKYLQEQNIMMAEVKQLLQQYQCCFLIKFGENAA